ncbi:hypothetical protein C8F01DRAFT_1076263 [Mycena amicta]|nr:hypothetical protein C8F01DRAFT_1076263 [Mycena amicta]
MSNDQNDNPPPAYDAPRPESPAKDVKRQPVMTPGPIVPYAPLAGPSYSPANPVVFHYHNPRTGEHVASLLPPDHPEMVCLQRGEHEPQTSFSLLGYIMALLGSPLGSASACSIARVKCGRCGQVLQDGLCA